MNSKQIGGGLQPPILTFQTNLDNDYPVEMVPIGMDILVSLYLALLSVESGDNNLFYIAQKI